MLSDPLECVFGEPAKSEPDRCTTTIPLVSRIEFDEVRLIDVRSNEEWKSGRIARAERQFLERLPGNISQFEGGGMREDMTRATPTCRLRIEEYMTRILFLKGSPELTMAKTPVRAASLKAMFESDLVDEKEAVEFYTKASIQASEDSDIGTRTLFERIALDEEQHMSWLELQLDLLARMGEPAFISKHMPSPAQASTQA